VNDLNVAIDKQTNFGFEVYLGPEDEPTYNTRNVLMREIYSSICVQPMVELVEPLSKKSAVSNLLTKDCRLYHVAYLIGDIERTIKALKERYWVLISTTNSTLLRKPVAFFMSPNKYLIEFIQE
jgi:hypothetical protein